MDCARASAEYEANWHRITCEWMDGDPHRTELGALEHQWLAHR